jgi:hypothetical protein
MRSNWFWFAGLAACTQGHEAAQLGALQDRLAAAGSGTGPSSEQADDECEDTLIGSGKLSQAIAGPAPREAESFVGPAFGLVKNWDFGQLDTVRDIATLSAQFDYHDQFGTIANGANYGAVSVAPTPETAINSWNLNLPNDLQPVEDPERPYRELTAHSLKTYVRPLDPTQESVSAAAHDAGSGSMMAKWHLPKAGAVLGHDLLWETRVRIPKPVQGYWFALWTAGTTWDLGPEIDVAESFGAPHVPHSSFHATAVGGTNTNDFTSWPGALDRAGVPAEARDLRDWHTWTLVYLRDDSYRVYFDGYVVQQGMIHWRTSGDAEAAATGLHFLFDFGWGHTGVPDVNIALWASHFPLVYEIDYSRVYLR